MKALQRVHQSYKCYFKGILNLTYSARKRNRIKVLANYNKTRINIGHQHDRWVEFKEALGVQTHANVPLRIYFGN
jgi:hypothetical protein